MAHPLVEQLRFTRSEWRRGLADVTAEEAARIFEPVNPIAWMVGHLANQEHTYWILLAQGRNVAPGLNDLVGTGKPRSNPPLDEMWAAWREITAAADAYLEGLTDADMLARYEWKGKPNSHNVGTLLLRNVYHYWYHLGEAQAVRQLLGHKDLPQFVGSIQDEAPYREVS
jgi:hypothetical protein